MIIELIPNHFRAISQRDYIETRKNNLLLTWKVAKLQHTFETTFGWLVSLLKKQLCCFKSKDTHEKMALKCIKTFLFFCFGAKSYYVKMLLLCNTYALSLIHISQKIRPHTCTHTHILTISKQNMPLWEILKNKNRT